MSLSKVASSTRVSYIPALDGVRLLAVLLVVLHHLTRGSSSSVLLHLIGLQRDNGIGPSLFFVLSGVLLTQVILANRNSEHRYRNFLMRRVLRIFPLYFAYLTLAVTATWIVTGRPPQDFWVFGLFLQNTFLHTAASTGSVVPMYHFWTLAVQDQFYLFWPLLLWSCTSTRKMRQLCYGLIVLSFLTRVAILHPALTPETFGRILPSRAGEMCLGALIAFESRERTLLTPLLQWSLLPLTLGCSIWMWFGLNILSPMGSTLGLQVITLACGALIATALQPDSWTAKVLGSRYVALAGKKYAFAMYIFHPMVLNLCTDYLPIASKSLRLGLFAATTLALSALSYRFFERPFLQMPIGRSGPQPALQPSMAKRSFLSI